MSNPHIAGLDPTGAIQARLANPAVTSQAPGTLSKWEDGEQNHYWEFVGNGETSSTDFVQTVAQREAAGGDAPEMALLAAQRPMAQVAARSLLGTDNPDAPIAKGEVKELSLKSLLSTSKSA